jgi:glucokinase
MSSARHSDQGAGPAVNVIGVDIGGTNIDLALADRAGTIRHRARIATLAEDGPRQALARIAAVAGRLAQRATAPVVAYAAVCPGVVRPDRILMAPNLPGWENLALAEHLEAALGVARVEVSNDVRAGALAELRHGALRGVDPGVYVSLGTGIAAALTVGHQVVAGAHGASGEIAYLVPTGEPSSLVSSPEAPLENIVGGKALGRRASAVLGEPLGALELFTRTDPAARQLIDRALDVLADALANIAVFIDPERVVVGGGMMASAKVILPALAERLKQVVPFAPDLTAARFTVDASLHGAIALALDTRPEHVVADAGATQVEPAAPADPAPLSRTTHRKRSVAPSHPQGLTLSRETL